MIEQKEKTIKKTLPVWLTVIIVIETLPMFMGPLLTLLRPDSFPGFDQLSNPVFVAWLYAARNFAVGIAFPVAPALSHLRVFVTQPPARPIWSR